MAYNTPGVYVEEISTLPASVAGVATAIPGFLGYTETDVKGEPTRISSMAEFEENFGGPVPGGIVLDAAGAYVSSNTTYFFYYAMQMYFSNGGGPCWVRSVGTYDSPDAIVINDFKSTASSGNGFLDELALIDEITLLVSPEAGNTGDESIYVDMLTQCGDLGDRFAIMDVQDTGSFDTNTDNFRSAIGTSNLKYGAAYYPFLKTSITFPDSAVDYNGTDLATMKASPTGPFSAVADVVAATVAAYPITLPPSSAIAGIYCRTDRNRGVWKAPANVSLSGVVEPNMAFTKAQTDDLNIDATAGLSINAIRSFTGKGTMVWGARTLAGNDNEWRYVPVRRLFIMVEESINKATQAVVFEPNNASTWTKVRVMIENFLTDLWKDGALAGAAPKDAFFVNVGLGSTMTSQDILDGKLIIEIGVAAVRPAEFIILRFSHKLQNS